jgi:hypothetical protein
MAWFKHCTGPVDWTDNLLINWLDIYLLVINRLLCPFIELSRNVFYKRSVLYQQSNVEKKNSLFL